MTELVTILGQSQPRISTHFKLLVEVAVAEVHHEGAWVFFLAASGGAAGIIAFDRPRDACAGRGTRTADRGRLAEVRRARTEQAARYFAAWAAK